MKDLHDLSNFRIAVLFPEPTQGSGGHKTILRHVEALQKHGAKVDIFISGNFKTETIDISRIKLNLLAWFGVSNVDVLPIKPEVTYGYDIAIATAWWTAYELASFDAFPIYFVQDLEDRFSPGSIPALQAELTYSMKLPVITIGKWLALETQRRGSASLPTVFGVDHRLYRPIRRTTRRPRSVLLLDQPEKPRRGTELIQQTIRELIKSDPTLVIHTYGSALKSDLPGVVSEGLQPESRLANAYQHFGCGVSISATNPSRVPFEMAACGMPVVEVFGPNTSLDFEGTSISRALPTPEAMATKILDTLESPQIYEQTFASAKELLKTNKLEDESNDFIDALVTHLNETRPPLIQAAGTLAR